MRFIQSLLFIVLFSASLQAQKMVNVQVTLENCSVTDSLVLFRFEGMGMLPVLFVKAGAERGKFSFTIPEETSPKFYYLAVNITESPKVRPFLVFKESNINIMGPCYDITQSKVISSPLNMAYESAINRNNELKLGLNQLIMEYRGVMSDPVRAADVERRMAINDQAKRQFLDSLRRTNAFIGQVLSLDTYMSYQGLKDKSLYKDEVDYFGKAYFQQADLSNPVYDDVPLLYDMFINYTDVLTMVNLPESVQRTYIDAQLAKIPEGTKARRVALSGVVNSLISKKASNAVYYGEMLIKIFGPTDPTGAQRIQQQVAKIKAESVGGQAPEIVMNDINGKPLPLSSLRGNVVLIDFWASWCGPCRRENPNVVALYNEYKNKGFTVYSVSLDQDQAKWLAAIQADNLTWPSHVSDLLGWQNAAAKQYGVSSIPQTLLLDKQGNILARNLRGEALAMKLKEVLGSN